MATTDCAYSDKSYDRPLGEIPCLTWLPWVGRDYECTRVLVIGLNHHQLDGNNPDNEREFTRRVIREQGISGCNTTPFIRTLARIIGCHSQSIWQAVAFHNLMLRSHPPSDKGFPSASDWRAEKCVLDKILCVLKPKFCLICSTNKVRLDRHFGDYNLKRREEIGRTAPKIGKSVTHVSTVACIHEPSRANVHDWRRFLYQDPSCRPHMESLTRFR